MNTAREIISRTILNSKCRNLLGATKKRLISQNTEIRRYNVLALNFFFSVLCFARLIITVNTIRKNWSKVRRTYEPVINAVSDIITAKMFENTTKFLWLISFHNVL